MYQIYFTEDKTTYGTPMFSLEDAKHVARCLADWGHPCFVMDTNSLEVKFDVKAYSDLRPRFDNPGLDMLLLKRTR